MIGEFVNLNTYPLENPDEETYRHLVSAVRRDLQSDGFIVLPDFLRTSAITRFNEEIAARSATVYYSDHGPSAYFKQFADPLPYEVLNSKTYVMGRDKLIGTSMDELYHWAPLQNFVAAVLGHDQVYRHEDPCNALIVQMYKTGCEVGWHFDRTLFTCIINLSEPDEGGIFECVPDLRTEEDPNLSAVDDVIRGRSTRVQQYHVKPGSFTITRGRHTFHRVTPIGEGQARTSLVLTYESEPGVRISDNDRRTIFGPEAPN